jgi:hypothetical protein
MENLDLNIDNYSLEDLFHLFKITVDFTERDLKKIKLIVLNTHPDKSSLPNEYFFFFSKAYKIIYNIYLFKNKQGNKQPVDYEHVDFLDKTENSVLLDEYLNKNNLKNTQEFNVWFNKNFEKYKTEKDVGYGEWLKSDENIVSTENIQKTEMNDFLKEQKRKSQALIKSDKIEEFSFQGSSYYDLNEHEKNSFSDRSSSLQYNDLKQAHIETLIPVVEEDYFLMKKYNNVNEMKSFRDSQDVSNKPMSKEESITYWKTLEKQNEEKCVKTAYYYAQQTEEILRKEEQFWSSIKNIKM